MFSRLRKSYLGTLGGFSLPLLNLSIEISMVSSGGIFVNKESTSRLAMYKLRYYWQLYFPRWNESRTVYSRATEDVKTALKSLLVIR